MAKGAGPIWEHRHGQIYLGGDAFVARMKAHIGTPEVLVDAPHTRCRPAPTPLATHAAEASDRAAAMAAAYTSGDYTLHTIAQHFGVHESTVSRAVDRCRRR